MFKSFEIVFISGKFSIEFLLDYSNSKINLSKTLRIASKFVTSTTIEIIDKSFDFIKCRIFLSTFGSQ